MNNTQRDKSSSLVFLFIAIGICLGSIRLSLGEFHRPGPGFFSFLAGGILGVLSLIVFLRSLRRTDEEEKRAFWPDPRRRLKIVWVVIALILYSIGMNYLGFFFSTLLFLGFLLRGIDPQRWLITVSVSLLGTLIAYGIFEYWLDIPLPGGMLGF